MSIVRVHNFSVSLDGYGTGEGQSSDAPFGHAQDKLMRWFFDTRLGRTVHGETGPIETTSPMTYAHASMKQGDVVEWAPPAGHTALIHVFDGDAHVNDEAVASGQMAVFERSAGTVRVVAGEAGAEVLVLGGEPLGEPVARYGPFVMNTREELMTAVQEFNDGTLVKVGKATL